MQKIKMVWRPAWGMVWFGDGEDRRRKGQRLVLIQTAHLRVSCDSGFVQWPGL